MKKIIATLMLVGSFIVLPNTFSHAGPVLPAFNYSADAPSCYWTGYNEEEWLSLKQFGHPVGDDVITSAVDIMKQNSPKSHQYLQYAEALLNEWKNKGNNIYDSSKQNFNSTYANKLNAFKSSCGKYYGRFIP